MMQASTSTFSDSRTRSYKRSISAMPRTVLHTTVEGGYRLNTKVVGLAEEYRGNLRLAPEYDLPAVRDKTAFLEHKRYDAVQKHWRYDSNSTHRPKRGEYYNMAQGQTLDVMWWPAASDTYLKVCDFAIPPVNNTSLRTIKSIYDRGTKPQEAIATGPICSESHKDALLLLTPWSYREVTPERQKRNRPIPQDALTQTHLLETRDVSTRPLLSDKKRTPPSSLKKNRILDVRVNGSYRVPAFGESRETFWRRLYEREAVLVVNPCDTTLLPEVTQPCVLGDIKNALVQNTIQNSTSSCRWSGQNLPNLASSRPPEATRNNFSESSNRLNSWPLVDTDLPHKLVNNNRQAVVGWMKKVVSRMRWKHSTYFVSIHALDSYCSLLTCPDTGLCLSASIPSRQWTVMAAAALLLGAFTEEEQVETLRVKRFMEQKGVASSERLSLTDVFKQQLHMVSELKAGLLVTRTPEDFLFYFLANMKHSSRFSPLYTKLVEYNDNSFLAGEFSDYGNVQVDVDTVQCPSARRWLRASEKVTTPPFFKEASRITQQEPYQDNSGLESPATMSLSLLVELVLYAARLCFERGGYSVLPPSRLTAACLIPVLTVACCPALGSSENILSEFSSRVFIFDPPSATRIAMRYCLPLICRYLEEKLTTTSVSSDGVCVVEAPCGYTSETRHRLHWVHVRKLQRLLQTYSFFYHLLTPIEKSIFSFESPCQAFLIPNAESPDDRDSAGPRARQLAYALQCDDPRPQPSQYYEDTAKVYEDPDTQVQEFLSTSFAPCEKKKRSSQLVPASFEVMSGTKTCTSTVASGSSYVSYFSWSSREDIGGPS